MRGLLSREELRVEEQAGGGKSRNVENTRDQYGRDSRVGRTPESRSSLHWSGKG